MAPQLPQTMLALAIHQFSVPKDYGIATLPIPKISQPDEVLIKVKSAAINPGELKLASGLAKLTMKEVKFPWIMGYDVAGIVIAVGSSVSNLSPGNEVYSKVPEKYKGTVAHYAISAESNTARKPKTLDFCKSAGIPLAAVTALQSLKRADEQLEGGLKGKTVLIPGGLSGTGHFGVQLAKNVFGCAKVITTLSTSKIQKFKDLLGEDYQILDYTKESLTDGVPKGSVDFMFDTMGGALAALPLIKAGGVIVSISSSVPSGTALKEGGLDPPFILLWALNFFDWLIRCWARVRGVKYSSFFPKIGSDDLAKLAEWVDEGKVVPVVGSIAKFTDLEGIRMGCQQVFEGKGGVGKFVIEVD